jgi:uncharacterized protein YcnI
MSYVVKRAVIGAAVAFGIFGGANPANAHVVFDQNTAPAGGYFKAVLLVPHGCEASPTTTLRVQIPENIYVVRPQQKTGWDVQIVKKPLSPPVAGPHGKTITDKITEIIWSNGNLADEFYDEFGLIVKLPDQPAGTKLVFPVVQQCTKGESRWVSPPDVKDGTPAPVLILK